MLTLCWPSAWTSQIQEPNKIIAWGKKKQGQNNWSPAGAKEIAGPSAVSPAVSPQLHPLLPPSPQNKQTAEAETYWDLTPSRKDHRIF